MASTTEHQPVAVFRGHPSELPFWLAERHRRLPVSTSLTVDMASAMVESLPLSVDDIFTGAGFGQLSHRGEEQWSAVRLRTLPDWIRPDLRALIIGLNPSPASADNGVSFARPGNRFWPAALAAGLLSADRDPLHAITVDLVGFTDLVKRTTSKAAELTAEEYRLGVDRLNRLVAWLRPSVCIVVGLSGWRSAVDRGAAAGWQAGRLGGQPVYLMANTSGLNAHCTLDDFTSHFITALGPERSRGQGRDRPTGS